MGAQTEQYGGGSGVLNQVYGPAWALDQVKGRTAKVIYDKIQSIGAGFGNTAFVRASGSDVTGTVGNYLLPFATVGAAAAAIAGLPNAELKIDSGSYILNDANAPYGLKIPGSSYTVTLQPGTTIEYYGTYGLWIAPIGTTGDLSGYGIIRTYNSTFSGSVDGINNYAINIGISTVSCKLEISDIINQSTATTSGTIRIGNCTSSSCTIDISKRIIGRGNNTIFLDTGSRTEIQRIGLLTSTSSTKGILKIVNPTESYINNIYRSQAYGTYTGVNQPNAVDITNDSNANIVFNNCKINAVETNNVNYYLIQITNNGTVLLDNIEFRNCEFKNNFASSFVKNGYSIRANNMSSIKVITSPANRDTANINNLIINYGFILEPNL